MHSRSSTDPFKQVNNGFQVGGTMAAQGRSMNAAVLAGQLSHVVIIVYLGLIYNFRQTPRCRL